MYITVSGPASSGKGTISRSFAQKFGLTHVDAGLIFRWVAYLYDRAGGALEIGSELLERHPMRYVWNGCLGSIEYEGELLNSQLAHPEIANLTAELASDPKHFVRMIEITERIIGSSPEAIVDGRSAGTVLLPHAEVKFYVDAPIHVRAARRLADLIKDHPKLTYDDVLSQLNERDRKDRTRLLDPLRIPRGALLVDSSAMSVSEAMTYMRQIVQARTSCF